jgi:CheY-like chemotaxis protein
VDALKSRIGLRIRASENEKNAVSTDSAPDVSREKDLSDKTILVVDDIVLNREIVAGILEDVGGLTLDFAGDGREAVTKFAKSPNRYSIILMDVHMPVMSGIDATRKIRSLDIDRAREIPIIALTASVTEEETGLCFTSGMNAYVSKPVDYAELINTIAEYCY